MPEVTVRINGRSYELACGEGEEGHLQEMAAYVDAKIASIRDASGGRSDGQLLVLASILIADELSDERKRINESELAADLANQVSFLESASVRLEALAARLEAA